MVIEFLDASMDNYLSWGNNYYLYDCPVMKTFVFLEWDMERSFGNSAVKQSIQYEGDYRRLEVFYDRPITKAMFRVPYFRTNFENALEKIHKDIFNPEISFPVIDSLAKQLNEDVAWDKTLARLNRDKDFSISPEVDPDNQGIIPNEKYSALPKNYDRELDGQEIRMGRNNMTYQKSVDGPSGFLSLLGVKEFIQRKYNNVKQTL